MFDFASATLGLAVGFLEGVLICYLMFRDDIQRGERHWRAFWAKFA